ncbi:MAG TPA: helix-turn-helix domain-containing protein [Opitutaceae bacterium]|nr:helix-turn-helix domain-containing protein [Opitutaceae bacterium]
MQSRAEVLAWLLAHESGHPAQIARETGYFRGSVQNVLNELEISGHVYAARDGREKRFVAPRDDWRFLLTWSPDGSAEFPQWVPWALLFTLICRFCNLIESPAFAGYSADLQGIELNRALTPLRTRLSSEGYRPRDLAKSIEGHTAAQVRSHIQGLIETLGE